MLWRHLNFCQISHRFTSSFANPSFQDLNGSHIMYWNMIILNPSRFKVEPHSKYWYFCIERCDLLSLRFSENAVLFHIEWLCQKTAGNVNWPPYRYTAVTHWVCPASSATFFSKLNTALFWKKGRHTVEVSILFGDHRHDTYSLTECMKTSSGWENTTCSEFKKL